MIEAFSKAAQSLGRIFGVSKTTLAGFVGIINGDLVSFARTIAPIIEIEPKVLEEALALLKEGMQLLGRV